MKKSISEFFVSCDDSADILIECGKVYPLLQSNMRDILYSIQASYVARYGLHGLWERCNGKSIAQILDDFPSTDLLNVVASGEHEGLKYTLYDSPTQNEGNQHQEERGGQVEE